MYLNYLCKTGYHVLYTRILGSQTHVVFNAPLNESAIIRIYDDQGRMTGSQPLGSGTTESTLELSGLTEGLYLLVIQSTQFITTKKLAVIR